MSEIAGAAMIREANTNTHVRPEPTADIPRPAAMTEPVEGFSKNTWTREPASVVVPKDSPWADVVHQIMAHIGSLRQDVQVLSARLDGMGVMVSKLESDREARKFDGHVFSAQQGILDRLTARVEALETENGRLRSQMLALEMAAMRNWSA